MKRYKPLFEKLYKTDTIKDYIVDVYINPKSIDKMMPWMRGIITKKGNLYVFDYEYTGPPQYPLIHAELTSWMDKNIPSFSSHYYTYNDNPLDYLEFFITVEREAGSNTFLLAESYDPDSHEDFPKEFDEYAKKLKQKTKYTLEF